MSTSRERLEGALERARRRLGPDAPIVKSLEQQLAASELAAGRSAQEMYLSQRTLPKEPPESERQ